MTELTHLANDSSPSPQERARLLQLLPAMKLLQLARDAAKSADVDWLQALSTAGLYVIPESSAQEVRVGNGEVMKIPFSQERYHVSELPFVASIADRIASATIEDSRLDPGTGRRLCFGGILHQARVKAPPEFVEFFSNQVRVFLSDAAARIGPAAIESLSGCGNTFSSKFAEDRVRFLSRSFESSAGALMALACALDEPAIVRRIAEVVPKASGVVLSSAAIGNPTFKENQFVTPRGVALYFGSLSCIREMQEFGWDIATDPVAYYRDSDVRKNGPHYLSTKDEPVTTLRWLGDAMDAWGLIIAPSLIEHLTRSAFARNQNAQTQEAVRGEVLNLAALAFRSDDKLVDVFHALDRVGCLSGFETELSIHAAKAGHSVEAAQLASKAVWGEWSGDKPLRQMDVFPPILLMQAHDASGNGTDEELDDVVSSMLKDCMDAGFGNLIASRTETSSCIRAVAAKGLRKSFLLCLESGADPRNKTGGYLSAEDFIEDESMHAILHAFEARQQAQAAMAEMDLRP